MLYKFNPSPQDAVVQRRFWDMATRFRIKLNKLITTALAAGLVPLCFSYAAVADIADDTSDTATAQSAPVTGMDIVDLEPQPKSSRKPLKVTIPNIKAIKQSKKPVARTMVTDPKSKKQADSGALAEPIAGTGEQQADAAPPEEKKADGASKEASSFWEKAVSYIQLSADYSYPTQGKRAISPTFSTELNVPDNDEKSVAKAKTDEDDKKLAQIIDKPEEKTVQAAMEEVLKKPQKTVAADEAPKKVFAAKEPKETKKPAKQDVAKKLAADDTGSDIVAALKEEKPKAKSKSSGSSLTAANSIRPEKTKSKETKTDNKEAASDTSEEVKTLYHSEGVVIKREKMQIAAAPDAKPVSIIPKISAAQLAKIAPSAGPDTPPAATPVATVTPAIPVEPAAVPAPVKSPDIAAEIDKAEAKTQAAAQAAAASVEKTAEAIKAEVEKKPEAAAPAVTPAIVTTAEAPKTETPAAVKPAEPAVKAPESPVAEKPAESPATGVITADTIAKPATAQEATPPVVPKTTEMAKDDARSKEEPAKPRTPYEEIFEPTGEEANTDIIKKIPSHLNQPKSSMPDNLEINRARETNVLGKQSGDTVTAAKAGIKIEVKEPPLDINNELDKAYNSLMSGETDAAIMTYKTILENDPKNRNALFGLATTYHRIGNYDMARTLYAELLAVDPNNRDGLNNFLGLLADESPQEALKQLAALESRNPQFSPIPAQMAVIYQKLGNYDMAGEQMMRAIDLAPENLTYRYNYAIMLDRQGRYEEAAPLYRQIVKAYQQGEPTPGNIQKIQQRLTFISSNRH